MQEQTEGEQEAEVTSPFGFSIFNTMVERPILPKSTLPKRYIRNGKPVSVTEADWFDSHPGSYELDHPA